MTFCGVKKLVQTVIIVIIVVIIIVVVIIVIIIVVVVVVIIVNMVNLKVVFCDKNKYRNPFNIVRLSAVPHTGGEGGGGGAVSVDKLSASPCELDPGSLLSS